jgi:next-to-BRCA1 protein 1
LQLQPSDKVVFERYSDSAASYVTLDPENHHVYKTLFRAAKAKLKLRLRATLPEEERGSAVRVATHAFSSASSYVPPTDLYAPPLYGNMPPSFAYNSYVPFSHQLAVPQSTVQPDKSGPVLPPVPETSQPKKVDSKAEAPVSPPSNTSQSKSVRIRMPKPGSPRGIDSAPNTVDNFAGLAFRPKEVVQGPWVVYCNNCDVAMENEHFHCSICENGDYDLCLNCVGDGVHCPGSNHWLLKRFVKDGQVENSSTERIAPKADSKPKAKSVADQGMPGAFMEEKQPVVIDLTAEEPDRTCNCCVKGKSTFLSLVSIHA